MVKSVLRMLLAGTGLYAINACGAAKAPLAPAPMASSTATSVPPSAHLARETPVALAAPGQYLPLYRDLISRIERMHVFAGTEGQQFTETYAGPAYWRAAKPLLEREFAEAKSKSDVIVALGHLQHSLRDGHCEYAPPELPKGDPARDIGTFMLGLDLFTEGRAVEVARAYVAKVRRPGETRAREGDELIAIDGIPLATWGAAHPFETSATDPEERVHFTFNSAVWLPHASAGLKVGDLRTLRLRRAAAEFDVPMAWDRPPVFGIGYSDGSDNEIEAERPLAGLGCVAQGTVNYPSYTFSGGGMNYCFYRSEDARYRAYPIVRFLSFHYSGGAEWRKVVRAFKADMESLQLRLQIPHAGVVVDMRENHGGYNPHLFTRWFTDKPFDNELVHTRVVHDELPMKDLTAAYFDDEDKAKQYQAAQRAGTAWLHETFMKAPALLPPMLSDRVSKMPAALIVGPGCKSSCDDMAISFARNRLGPIVGRQTGHILTSTRFPMPIRDASGADLGTIQIALSYSTRGEDPLSLEGRPLTLTTEIPKRFSDRLRDDEMHVDAAIAELKHWRPESK
jgi:hypothetical protein